MNDIAKGHVFFIYLIPHWIVCFAFFTGTSPMFIRCSRLSNICCVCFKFLLMLFNEKRLSCIDSPFGWHHSSVYLRMAWPYRILKDIPQSISCMLLNFWWIWIWRPWLRAWAKTLEIEQALLSRFDALLGVQHYFSGLFPQDLSCQKAQSL